MKDDKPLPEQEWALKRTNSRQLSVAGLQSKCTAEGYFMSAMSASAATPIEIFMAAVAAALTLAAGQML